MSRPWRPTLAEALHAARDRLASAGIEDAAIEAELLLRHALAAGGDAAPGRARLYGRLQEQPGAGVRQRFDSYLERRLRHEPSAYITGRREFYGLEFEVTPAVLVPRPETEMLIEATIELARRYAGAGPYRVVDAGTGSGCIAVAIACALPAAALIATDVSTDALDVARRNARRHGVETRVDFRQGDLLAPLEMAVDLVVANLPYVTTAAWQALPPELRDHEPRAALDGGADGLDLLRRLLDAAPAVLRPAGAVCLECGAGQALDVVAYARGGFADAAIETRRDLAGHERVVLIRT